MKTISNWRGKDIQVATSKSGVLAVVDPKDNFILPETTSWPPPEIVQKLYQSRQIRAFKGDDHKAVTRALGFYSDLQSLHSEDAITWSVFGVLAHASLQVKSAFLNALFGMLDIASPPNHMAHFALWRRIPHPDTLVSGGPEIDVILQTERVMIFVEAKWRSGVGRAQGKDGKKDQIMLRREFLEKYGEAIYESASHFIVLGVGWRGGLFQNSDIPLKRGRLYFRDTTWEAVCKIESHPFSEELQSYLRWKEQNSKQI